VIKLKSNSRGTAFLIIPFLVLSIGVCLIGYYLFKGRCEVSNDRNTKQTQSITTPLQQSSNIEPDVIPYPSDFIMNPEGTAYIENEDSYPFWAEKSFILILTKSKEDVFNKDTQKFESGKSYKYKINLPPSIDSVSKPLISYGSKYGCVTLQSSGYIGYYVFDIESGKGIDKGPQYSKCLDWIDASRVHIIENLYNTKVVTYFLLNVTNKDKLILSRVSVATD